MRFGCITPSAYSPLGSYPWNTLHYLCAGYTHVRTPCLAIHAVRGGVQKCSSAGSRYAVALTAASVYASSAAVSSHPFPVLIPVCARLFVGGCRSPYHSEGPSCPDAVVGSAPLHSVALTLEEQGTSLEVNPLGDWAPKSAAGGSHCTAQHRYGRRSRYGRRTRYGRSASGLSA